MRRICRIFLVLIIAFVFPENIYCLSPDYIEYYKKQEIADSLLYVENNFTEGFTIYKNIFKEYDFVWMEDCMRVCQVALIANDSETALIAIKKAIDNGLELDKIKYLNLGCQCNYYIDARECVGVFDSFINSHYIELSDYYSKNRPLYLSKINQELLKQVIFNHVEDEFYKCDKNQMAKFKINFQKKWKEVLDKNYSFIDSLFTNGIFVGSKNLGYSSELLMSNLKLNDFSIQSQKNIYYEKYGIRENEDGRGYPLIPTVNDSEFFFGSPLYITFYHDIERFQKLLKMYYLPLVKEGYLHPREYMLLLVKSKKTSVDPCVQPSTFDKYKETSQTNKIRQKYYLPKIEIDIAKHNFAHKHKIQLFFGFLSTTR